MRITKRRLEELDETLSDKDKAILRSVQLCRYLTTGQIHRLHYHDSKNALAGLRAANWGTAKLRGLGLLDVLDRRVGGFRAGCKSFVFVLTEAGVNLLKFMTKEYSPRKRDFEPSIHFMKHTLEVSEVYVQLVEICRQHQLKLVKIEMEPNCWRGYKDENHKPATMKPDMFVVTDDDIYEYYRFIEVDMNTESPSVVVEKCRRYALYYKSGLEQKEHGLFPRVIWLAYSENRKAKLQQYIIGSREIPEHRKNIFVVITPSEFEALILGDEDIAPEQEKDTG
jgi:hypothetical protein